MKLIFNTLFLSLIFSTTVYGSECNHAAVDQMSHSEIKIEVTERYRQELQQSPDLVEFRNCLRYQIKGWVSDDRVTWVDGWRYDYYSIPYTCTAYNAKTGVDERKEITVIVEDQQCIVKKYGI